MTMATGVARLVVLCVVVLVVRSEPHGVGLLRKGEGAPWGHYFSPGFGGYYTMDDFQPQTVVHIPVLPVSYDSGADGQQEILGVPDYGQQETQGPDFGQQAIQGPDYGQQATQGPDYGQQATQGPDYGQQATQGPDYGQVTQGPDLDQVTQGPDEVQITTPGYYRPEVPDTQSTNQPDDVQYTTPYPTTEYPTTHYPTTEYPTTHHPTTEYPTTHYPTTGYPTTTDDYVQPTTWRPRPQHDTCKTNPAAAGHAPGTKLICTVEACPSSGGVKGGHVKGGHVKGGHVKGGHVKGGHGQGESTYGLLDINIDLRRGRVATTLVCRPFNGCDEPVQTTETPAYTTPAYTTHEYPTPAYTTHEYPTPAYSTPGIPEETTPAFTTPGYEIPEYTTPVPTTLPPPPPPTLPPGIKGGHRPHVPGVKGHRGDVHLDSGVKGGVKGGFQHKWEPQVPLWDEGVKGVKGVKGGRRPNVTPNVSAYGGFVNQWESIEDVDSQWGLKTARRRPPVAIKGHQEGLEQEAQQAKGQGRHRRPGGYQFGGWGHQDYQGALQGQQAGYYIQ